MTHLNQKDYSREYLQSLTPATCKQIASHLGLKPRYHKRRVIAQILNQQVFLRVERETRELLKANDLETTIENRWITIQTKDGLMISTSPYWGKIGYDVCKWLQGQNDVHRPNPTPQPTRQPTQQIKLENGVIQSGKIGWYVPNAAALTESLQTPDWELIEIRVTTCTRKVKYRGHYILTEPTYRAFAIYQSKTQQRKDGKPRRWAKRISMKTWQQFEVINNENIIPISNQNKPLFPVELPLNQTPADSTTNQQSNEKQLTKVGAGYETQR
jgi:hypothetical protein